MILLSPSLPTSRTHRNPATSHHLHGQHSGHTHPVAPCFSLPIVSLLPSWPLYNPGPHNQSDPLPSLLRTPSGFPFHSKKPRKAKITPRVLSCNTAHEPPLFRTSLTLIPSPPLSFLNLDHPDLLSVLQTCQGHFHLRTFKLLCPLPKMLILQLRMAQLKCHQFRKSSLTTSVHAARPSPGILSQNPGLFSS